MRKFLIVVVTILILTLAFFFIRDGLNIGDIHILGVFGIQELNHDLDDKLVKAKELTNVKFQEENNNLNSALTQAVKLREQYERVLQQSN